MRNSRVTNTPAGGRNELRIIGGQWRGRRLHFPDVAAIRPSPNRVRETLFNWLQFNIAGSRCLDLFAGSGALGLEALSRGAAHVTFVDCERAITDYLRQTLQKLNAQNATVHLQDARKFLIPLLREAGEGQGGGKAPAFDVVFLDPPFADIELFCATCETLETGGWLSENAFIYLETPARAAMPTLPRGWTLAKSERAGEVGYHLARRGNTT